jgi:hypothetical protein
MLNGWVGNRPGHAPPIGWVESLEYIRHSVDGHELAVEPSHGAGFQKYFEIAWQLGTEPFTDIPEHNWGAHSDVAADDLFDRHPDVQGRSRLPDDQGDRASEVLREGALCDRACSQPDPLHLVLHQPLLGAVVQPGGARALVRGHFLGVLKRSTIGEVGGDPGGAERVTADFRRDDAEALTRTIGGILEGWIDPEGPIRPVDPRFRGDDEMRFMVDVFNAAGRPSGRAGAPSS